MSKYTKKIWKEGASLAYQVEVSANEPIQYFPLSAIKGVTGRYASPAPGNLYGLDDLVQVTIDFYDHAYPPIAFDTQEITNQATWVATEAGLNIALADINSWISAGSGSGSSTAGSVVLTEDDALGGNGTHFIDVASGAITGATYKYLVVNDATGATFSVLADSASNDMLSTQNYSGKTVEKGMLIRAAGGELIKDITVSAGSVIGVE